MRSFHRILRKIKELGNFWLWPSVDDTAVTLMYVARAVEFSSLCCFANMSCDFATGISGTGLSRLNAGFKWGANNKNIFSMQIIKAQDDDES